MNFNDLALVTYPILLCIIGYMVKRWVDGLKEQLNELKALIQRYAVSQTSCQLSLREVYRTKDESSKEWSEHKSHEEKQCSRIDDHEKRITALETACKLNRE